MSHSLHSPPGANLRWALLKVASRLGYAKYYLTSFTLEHIMNK